MFESFSADRTTTLKERLVEVESALNTLSLCERNTNEKYEKLFGELRRLNEDTKESVLTSNKEVLERIETLKVESENKTDKKLKEQYVSQVYLKSESTSLLFQLLRYVFAVAILAVASSFTLIKILA